VLADALNQLTELYKSNNTSQATFTIAGVNRPPVAGADSYSMNENTLLVMAAPGVLGNDTDLDGDSLTALQVSAPSHGTLNLNPDGSFIYTPAAGFRGVDSFTYSAGDGQSTSSPATVTITVTALNQPPNSVNDTYSVAAGTTLTVPAPGVLGNDSDLDKDPLVAVLVSTTNHGALTLNANGSFSYTPAAGFIGSDSFSYKARDGTEESGIALVSISVFDPMVLMTCTNPQKLYPKLQQAYDEAPNGCVLKVRAVSLQEVLALGQIKTVTIKGGYDTKFQQIIGGVTGVKGLNILKGMSVVEYVMIK